uniref:DDHD domain-containing protein n=1 Tax=Trichobilharzia regenti TaxID=157069 RepID=A0AA85K0J0_TRIRE|nr:unnamed protein product [Trichobilharzia regenti]
MNNNLFDDQIPAEAVRWLHFRRSGGVSTWKPFCGYDSLRLETAYRERANGNTDPAYAKIIVRGEMFEVDMESNLCIPIYWFGKKRSVHNKKRTWCSTPVIRCVWFQKINWLPVDTKLSEIIEYEHRTYAIPKLKEATKRTHKPIHKYTSNNHEIKWMSDGTVYLVTKAAEPFGKIRLHGGLSSVPLSRGYHHSAESSDRPPPITHLCFVVHGIGQQLASIRHECAKFRKTCQKVAEKLYPKLSESGQRLEFIPVNWRSSLSLNSKTLDNVTIAQLRPLRAYINQSLVDILYYTSPVYRQVIMQSLSYELTRLFNLFCTHNPQFLQRGGRISVLAHSLGSVIMHDILKSSNSNFPGSLFTSMTDLDSNNGLSSPRQSLPNNSLNVISVREKKGRNHLSTNLYSGSKESLNSNMDRDSTLRVPNRGSFLENIPKPSDWKPVPQLANLFLIGSPLALFIAVNDLPATTDISSSTQSLYSTNSTYDEPEPTKILRSLLNTVVASNKHSGIDLDETDAEALFSYFACRRVFNIFHSYDPVAYRLEPLLLKHYASISPVVIPKASLSHLEKFLSIKDTLSNSISNLTSVSRITSLVGSGRSSGRSDTTTTSSNKSSSKESPHSDTPTLKGSDSSHSDVESLNSLQTVDLSDSGSSDESDTSNEKTPDDEQERRFFKRISVVEQDFVYKQHQSLAMKLFSNYVTRRSSNVTYLGPPVCKMRPNPGEEEKQLRRRVDFEWQKSFSPLAALGAHSSYWSSQEVAFFILYQIFGPPQILQPKQ